MREVIVEVVVRSISTAGLVKNRVWHADRSRDRLSGSHSCLDDVSLGRMSMSKYNNC